MAGQKHMRYLSLVSLWLKSFKHIYLNMQFNWEDKTKTLNSQLILWFRYQNNLLLKRTIFQGIKI